MSDTFEIRLAKAKIAIMTKSAFFSSVMLSLPLIETEEVPTLATDGECILYNKAFLEELDTKYWASALLHEVIHAALEHSMRRGTRDAQLWNVAADYWDNYTLIQMGFPVHTAWLRNDALAADKSVELIYKELMQQGAEQRNKAMEQARNSPMAGDVQPPPTGAEGEDRTAEIKEKMQRIMARAAREAKAAKEFGKLPAELQRMINDTIAPKLSWKEVLRNFISERMRDGTTWSKRNRRYAEFYLPAHESLGVSNVLIAIDTSGSINNKQLSEFMREVNAIREDVKPRTTTVVSCDTRIHNPQVFSAYEEINYKPVGGGGTAFNPVWKYAADLIEQPKIIIYFTDGYGSFGEQPEQPVLWIMYSQLTAPFGETVRFI